MTVDELANIQIEFANIDLKGEFLAYSFVPKSFDLAKLYLPANKRDQCKQCKARSDATDSGSV